MQHDTIFELRDYTLHSGRRETLVELFEAEFIKPQNAVGAHVRGIFRDIDRPDHFVWIRSFADMAARRAALTDFYSGPVWSTFRNNANATMVDSDDVHLLRPIAGAVLREGAHDGALVVAEIYPNVTEGGLADVLKAETGVLASFVTETAANDYPALPVRTDRVGVVLRVASDYGALRSIPGLPRPSRTLRLRPTRQSPIILKGSEQSVRDFDFLQGDWTVRNRKLKARLSGCADWDEFDAAASFRTYLDGRANVDEFDYSEGGFKGMSVRTLDVQTNVWSIYWADSVRGSLTPPVHGGFTGGEGHFLGRDIEGGKPVQCQFKWRTEGEPRWEQAFSTDEGQSWETNWVMEFKRR